MNTRTKITLILATVVALAFGSPAGANAYWYNTAAVVGSQSIQVKNTNNAYFYVAPGRSAYNVNRAWAGWRQCIRVRNMQNFATWTKCFPQGGYVDVPAQPLGVIELYKYNY